MAVVIALVIAGWLVAFALGAQAGFDSEAVSEPTPVTKPRNSELIAPLSAPQSASLG